MSSSSSAVLLMSVEARTIALQLALDIAMQYTRLSVLRKFPASDSERTTAKLYLILQFDSQADYVTLE